MADDLAALGISVQEEANLRTGVEAQVEVDADPQTLAEARKLQDATRAVLKLEEEFDQTVEALADADVAVNDKSLTPADKKKAIDDRAELQRRRRTYERQLAEAAKNVQRMAIANKQAKESRLRRVVEAQRVKAEQERKARQDEEAARMRETRGETDNGREGAAATASSARPGSQSWTSSHALLNGAVSAGSRKLLSAKRAQRVLNTRIDRSHIDPTDLAPRGAGAGVGTGTGRADEAASTEAIRDYRGGSTVLDSALRVTVAGARRRDRGGGALVDDGDVERFNARQQAEVDRKERRVARRREGNQQAAAAAAADAAAEDSVGAPRRRRRQQPHGGGDALLDDEDDTVPGAAASDDDDDDADYVARMAAKAMREADLGAEDSEEGMSETGSGGGGGSDDDDDDDDEDVPDVHVLGDLSIPAKVWVNLLDYQQVGVRWLLEKHSRRTGGILGDEMGLGKTIQIAAMLSALHNSKELRRPVLILAPLTVLKQWVAELRKWVPALRTVLMHSSGSSNSSRQELLQQVANTPCVVMSTYQTAALEAAHITRANPQYVILDEGHKICNPDASITIAVKTIPTPHRLILSGSPIQNTLKELWCLFDFVAPGTLGSVSTFVTEFEEPIKASRSPSATTMAVQHAIECAKALRDHIAPYMLRRLKREVNTMLPPKHEKVVRCLLTDAQLQEYLNLLGSKEVQDFQRKASNLRQSVGSMDHNGRMYATGGLQTHNAIAARGLTDGLARQAFKALTDLRSITNHADLFRVKADHRNEGGHTGYVSFRSNNPVDLEASGKLKALDLLMTQWKQGGHRVLVFSQTRTCLDIIENLVEQRHYTYFRMDGTTPSHHRQPLIDRFNNDPNVFCALLTTRVGGLGVNLVGADRVVIFDPDWNPVTDEQARERAWRIGQTREVCIYRMVTSGTVEEHILHRQLAKLFVAEKVLSDPSLQRSFHLASMSEAFMLGPEYAKRVDSSSRGLVSLDSFSVGEEVRRGQVTLDAHGNTVGEPKKEEPDDDDDGTKPLQRRMILTNGGVTVAGPSASRGTTSRLAALEGNAAAPAPSSQAPARSQSHAGGAARGASMVQVKPEPIDAADAAVLRQSTVANGNAADEPPSLVIEELANEGATQQQAAGSQAPVAPSSASVDPSAETGILQGLVSGQGVADAADPLSMAARLARIAAHRTLHRATSATQSSQSDAVIRRGSSGLVVAQPSRTRSGGSQRQPLLPAGLQPGPASSPGDNVRGRGRGAPLRGRGSSRGGGASTQ